MRPFPLMVLFATLLGLSLAAADTPPPAAPLDVASGIAISQCGMTTGVILIDSHGAIHMADPHALEANPKLVDELLAQIPTGKGVTITVSCMQDAHDKVI